MTDQQYAGTVLPGHRAKAKTPVLDAFREESLTFGQAYCPSPHCCPSRASFFSGLYPSQHGVWNNVNVGNALSRGLYDGVRLFSEDLAEAGYRMDFHGKWHVSELEGPEERGWNGGTTRNADSRAPRAPNLPKPHEWRWFSPGDEKRGGGGTRREGEIVRPGFPEYIHYGTNENPFRDADVVEQALAVFKEREESDQPWCHYVGPLGPHDPYFPPQRFLDLYDLSEIELPQSFHDDLQDRPGFYRRTRDIFAQLTEREHREAIRHYLAFCSYEDYLFGRVLDALEESGQRDNTIVLYMSDHGDYVGAHGLWCKGLPCFREAYHVPVVVRWPGQIQQPGAVSDAMVSLTDFAPTFLEISGVEVHRPFAGRSLVPLLRGETPSDWRNAVFTQSNGNELYGIQRSVTTGTWKYVYNGFDYDELYNLEDDPHELVNLINKPEHKAVVRELCEMLWSFAREHEDTCINPYIMVGFAPYGPAFGLEKEEGDSPPGS